MARLRNIIAFLHTLTNAVMLLVHSLSENGSKRFLQKCLERGDFPEFFLFVVVTKYIACDSFRGKVD